MSRWRLVSVDFPGGPDWGFDGLAESCANAARVDTNIRELLTGSERLEDFPRAVAGHLVRAGDSPVVVVGSCAAHALAHRTAILLSEEGVNAVALAVDPETTGPDELREEAQSLIAEVERGPDGAVAGKSGSLSSDLEAPPVEEEALEAWVGGVRERLLHAARENQGMSSLPENLVRQLLARYGDWLRYYAECALCASKVGSAATVVTAAEASSALDQLTSPHP